MLRYGKKAPSALSMPKGIIKPIGYIMMQHAILDTRPVKAYQRWMNKIPKIYREAVLQENDLEKTNANMITVENDPYCLITLKHYRSLMPLAMEARKSIFFLKSADGAIGAHSEAVKTCNSDFEKLATRIAEKASITFPS